MISIPFTNVVHNTQSNFNAVQANNVSCYKPEQKKIPQNNITVSNLKSQGWKKTGSRSVWEGYDGYNIEITWK